jgi:phosphoribosylanthranilate isomerase
MLVKICGITRAEDAMAAVDAGAHALGFVFWPNSPRFIEPARARAIVAELPPFVTPVGVFVNQPAEHVFGVAATVGLGAVQLHGDERPADAARLARPIIKAIPVGAGDDVNLEEWPARVMLLLDVHDPVKRGGTGRTIDWSAAASIAARRRSILAGGLTPENVGEAIRAVRPFGIDVSSGIESSPGVKDHVLMKALFAAIARARESTLEREVLRASGAARAE